MWTHVFLDTHKHFNNGIVKEMIRLFLHFSYKKSNGIIPILNYRTINKYSKRIEKSKTFEFLILSWYNLLKAKTWNHPSYRQIISLSALASVNSLRNVENTGWSGTWDHGPYYCLFLLMKKCHTINIMDAERIVGFRLK